MRGKLRIVVVMTVLVLGLAGCSVKEKQKDTAEEQNQEDAVSQNARISEEQQKEILKADIEPGAVLTEHCLYTKKRAKEYGEEDGVVIIQTDHAGNELSRVTLELEDDETFDSLLCGSDKRIIYDRGFLGYSDKDLYSVPLLQTDTGETAQWDQAEKIATCQCKSGEFPNVYLQEPYLIYPANAHTMVRHNLETGTEETLELPVEYVSVFLVGIVDNYLYLDDMYQDDVGCLYRIDIAKWSLEKLFELENQEQINTIWIEGPFLYMEIGRDEDGFVLDRLECFDLEQKKTVGQLYDQDFIAFMKKEKLCTEVEEWEVYCEGVSGYAGKVYITLSLYDEERDDEKMVLLSCSEKDLLNLENEPEMTEWYYENRNYSIWSTLDGYEDLYYFDYTAEEGDGMESHLMCYHLDTKKIEEVGHDELIWRGYDAAGQW